jgi:hypothetical protein
VKPAEMVGPIRKGSEGKSRDVRGTTISAPALVAIILWV